MSGAMRREQEAAREHRRLQGQDPEAGGDKPAARSRDEAVDRASRDVERTLDRLDERTAAEEGT